MLLYSLLHLSGVKGVPMQSLRDFRKLGSNTPGHSAGLAFWPVSRFKKVKGRLLDF